MFLKSHMNSKNTLPQVTSSEINVTLKRANTKKGPGTNKRGTKIVDLASSFLSTPLAIVINNSVASSYFPGVAKTATVVLIGSTTDDKYDISNSRPASSLNGFVRVSGNIVK